YVQYDATTMGLRNVSDDVIRRYQTCSVLGLPQSGWSARWRRRCSEIRGQRKDQWLSTDELGCACDEDQEDLESGRASTGYRRQVRSASCWRMRQNRCETQSVTSAGRARD